MTDLFYRLKQKYVFQTTADPFLRKAAELNRFSQKIIVQKLEFKVENCALTFLKVRHGFILDNYSIFQNLNKHFEFLIVSDNLQLKIGEITLFINSAEELFIANEIFIHGVYNVYLKNKEYSVIDIGMNVGMATLFFARMPEVKWVYSYELFPSTYSQGLKNFQLNPYLKSKIHSFNLGWGTRNEERDIRYSNELKGQNSLELQKGEATEKVVLRKSDEILREIIEQSQMPVFIKMDCEGSEFDIISELEKTPLLEQIAGIAMEWHYKEPSEIIRILKSKGFDLLQTGHSKVGMIYAFNTGLKI